MKLDLNEIIKATNAVLVKGEKSEVEYEFSTDTRTIQPHQIYIPLKGETFDGEKFIDKALEKEIDGYLTIGCMQNALLTRRAVYDALVRTM